MTLEDLQQQIEKDLKIDDTQLDIESISTPILHAKYLKYYSTYSLMLSKAESDLSITYKQRWLYYTGKADPEVYKNDNFELKVIRQDVSTFIEADEVYIKIRQKVAYLKIVVKYLEDTLKQINNRTFQIKNAIDWKRFTEGSL